jgi:hypothetical protein
VVFYGKNIEEHITAAAMTWAELAILCREYGVHDVAGN